MIGTSQTSDPQTHYKDRKVATNYDKERFDSFWGRTYLALERRALCKAFRAIPPGGAVLDLPCGTGRIAQLLLDQGYRVTGMDIAEEMLEVARGRLQSYGDRFATKTVDAFNLPAVAPKFHAALCARVLMHFPLDKQAQFLNGVASLTDGPIIFTQSFVTSYQRTRQRIKRILRIRSKVRYPLTPVSLPTVLADAQLELERMHWIAAPISEAAIFVCTRTTSHLQP
jgi:2-polyprenyl-3-methyl-5-hydroxy-6-metoxy-1,4-benzoquinol methylase